MEYIQTFSTSQYLSFDFSFFFFSRRSFHFLRTLEHVRSYSDVHVLPIGRDGSKITTVSLVEKIFDRLPNDPICRGNDPRVPITLHRLQLSEGVRLVDRFTRDHVLLPVQRILSTKLPAKEEEETTNNHERDEKRSSAKSSNERHDEWIDGQFVRKKRRGRLLRERRQPSRLGAQS